MVDGSADLWAEQMVLLSVENLAVKKDAVKADKKAKKLAALMVKPIFALELLILAFY